MPLNLLPKTQRDRLYQRLPKWLVAQPHESFVSMLCLLAGIPLVLGQADAQSIEATMPDWAVLGWGFALFGGAALTLLGLILAERRSALDAVPWRRTERIGLVFLAYAGYIYATAVVVYRGLSTIPSVAIILAFALTETLRAFAIQVEIERMLSGIRAVGEWGPRSEGDGGGAGV